MKLVYDIALASFLITKNHKLAKTRNENGRVVFLFENSARLENDILDFYNHGECSALAFAETLRNLKALVFSQRR